MVLDELEHYLIEPKQAEFLSDAFFSLKDINGSSMDVLPPFAFKVFLFEFKIAMKNEIHNKRYQEYFVQAVVSRVIYGELSVNVDTVQQKSLTYLLELQVETDKRHYTGFKKPSFNFVKQLKSLQMLPFIFNVFTILAALLMYRIMLMLYINMLYIKTKEILS